MTLRVFKELMLQKSVQPCGLGRGARKTIENKSAFAIHVSQAPCHHVKDQIVGNEFSPRHLSFRLHSQIRAAVHILAEQVSGRYLRNAVAIREPLGLGALARAGRSKQHDWSDVAQYFLCHRTRSRLSPFPILPTASSTGEDARLSIEN